MVPPDQAEPTNLVANRLPAPAAAEEIRRCWADGEAVVVLDPRAPAAVTEAALARVQPTHLVDEHGRRPHPGGRPAVANVVAVVLTSGTTGDPKAVELTAAGREVIGAGFAAALAVDRDDRWLVCLPLHHVAGLAILGRSAGARFKVVTHDGFDLDAVAAAPERDGATVVSLVPTTLARLVDAGAPLARFRWIVTGGAPLPPALRARAEAVGARVVDTYGLSETWGGVLLDGTAVPGAAFRLGDDNELQVRGPMVMRGYRFDDAATAAALTSDGWFRTGDVGSIEPDGRITVTDRRHDVIITGGVNVSPTAVEAVLAGHPAVADVCVAGRPDAEWGDRVVAFVVAHDQEAPPSLDDLRAFAAARLTKAQLPRELVLIDAVPRTPGGKTQRRALT
ncbi:MAG TPA: fatty acid--CoA ligase family protein [Acidimicrobiia bacterium]|nr:fatty acid--CoA ligase family protein [Acidimicrobiia bacterium]